MMRTTMATRWTWTVTALVVLLGLPAPALHAGEELRDPTPAELATAILDGNAGEHALVAAWLEGATREELQHVFAALRVLRAQRAAEPRVRLQEVEPPLRPQVTAEQDPWAEHEGPLVNAEVRIVQVPVDAVAALLGAHRPTADRSWHLLTPAQAETLQRAIAEHTEATVLTAPRLTVFDTQKANVSVLNQVSYVQDYDLEITMGGSELADPIIGVVQEGVVLELTPRCDETAKTIEVELEGTFSVLQRPIPEEQLELAGKTVTIQLPQVEVGRVRATVAVPDGGWVLLGGGVVFQPEKDGPRVERFVLMHLKQLALPEAASPRAK